MIYWHVFTSAWRSSLLSRGTIAGWIFVMLIRLGVLASLYTFAYRQTAVATGTGISLMATLWSITTYFLFFSWGTRQLHREISSDFRLGTIETKIIKPYNYLVHAIVFRLGTGAAFVVPSVIAAGVFMWSLAGPPPNSFSIGWVLCALLVGIAGIVVSSLVYAIVGLTTAWLEDSDPLFWVMDKTILVFGGSYVPMALFPSSMRAVAEYTPFGAGTFLTQAFNPDFISRFGRLFAVQVAWIIVLGLCAKLIFCRASRKLSVNGG